jgi:hypothetical protein
MIPYHKPKEGRPKRHWTDVYIPGFAHIAREPDGVVIQPDKHTVPLEDVLMNINACVNKILDLSYDIWGHAGNILAVAKEFEEDHMPASMKKMYLNSAGSQSITWGALAFAIMMKDVGHCNDFTTIEPTTEPITEEYIFV